MEAAEELAAPPVKCPRGIPFLRLRSGCAELALHLDATADERHGRTQGRTMPEWAHAAAVRQALYAQRDWMGGLACVLWRRSRPSSRASGRRSLRPRPMRAMPQTRPRRWWRGTICRTSSPGSRAAQDPLRRARPARWRAAGRPSRPRRPPVHPDTPRRLRATPAAHQQPGRCRAATGRKGEACCERAPHRRATGDAPARGDRGDGDAGYRLVGALRIARHDTAAAPSKCRADLYLEQRRLGLASPGDSRRGNRARRRAPAGHHRGRRARARMYRRVARAPEPL